MPFPIPILVVTFPIALAVISHNHSFDQGHKKAECTGSGFCRVYHPVSCIGIHEDSKMLFTVYPGNCLPSFFSDKIP